MHKQIGRAGFTLMEVAMGAAVAGVLALVCSGLFKAGLESYTYASRQTLSVLSACRAFAGSGSRFGIVWKTQAASSVSAISTSTLSLIYSDTSTASFYVSNNALYQSATGGQTLQAKPVGSAVFSYYNLDSDGHIMASTAAASASLVTAKISVTVSGAKSRTYNFISGGRLHNTAI